MTSSTLRVGLLFSKEKKRKIKIPVSIDELCRSASIELIEINPDKPLDPQGPFDVLIHKVLDLCKDDDETHLENYVQKLQTYCTKNPSIMLIDPVPAVQVLADRAKTLELAQECNFEFNGRRMFVPSFLTFEKGSTITLKEKLRIAGIHFPVVCKSVYAAGHSSEHKMSLVYCEEFIDDISPPCVIQQFINHGGLMLKIYVIGDKYYICERPSIKDLSNCKAPTVYFKGTHVSKEGYTLPIHPAGLKSMTFRTSVNGEILDKEFVLELLKRLRTKLDVTLFGIDIIVDEKTGYFGLVDINYFPGYGGVLQHFVNDFFGMLKSLKDKKDFGLRQNDV